MHREGTESGGWGRESQAGSTLTAESPAPYALEPMNCEIMTWAKVRRLTDWTSQVPLLLIAEPKIDSQQVVLLIL